jgi:LacI family transcriptional regulator
VAFATLDDRLVAQLADRDLPLVLVNRRTVGVHGSVVVDDEGGSALAVRHLIALGHERIGCIGLAADTDTARRRERGYRRAMEQAGYPVQAGWIVNAAPTEAGGRGAVPALIRLPPRLRPSALFSASLLGAIGILAGLREAGIAVPAGMSLIAFNDHPLAAHLSPPLTTIRMANFEMGEAAVAMLLAAVEGRPVHDQMLDHPPEIVIRASTAPAATEPQRGPA